MGERPERESRERDKDRAEDLGLSGFSFIGREDDPAVCRALAEFLTDRLHQTFVSPESVSALHPEIAREMAWSTATKLSIELLQRAVQRLFDSRVKDLRADILQIVNGTSMGTHEALSMLCLGLKEGPEAVLAAARYRANSFSESLSIGDSSDLTQADGHVVHSGRALPESAWLRKQESFETIRAIGELMTSRLTEEMVASSAVRTLYPEIPPEMADGYAYELSLSLVMARLRAMPDFFPIDHSSLTQVLGGTQSSRTGALEALCRALDVSSADVLKQARAEGAVAKEINRREFR